MTLHLNIFRLSKSPRIVFATWFLCTLLLYPVSHASEVKIRIVDLHGHAISSVFQGLRPSLIVRPRTVTAQQTPCPVLVTPKDPLGNSPWSVFARERTVEKSKAIFKQCKTIAVATMPNASSIFAQSIASMFFATQTAALTAKAGRSTIGMDAAMAIRNATTPD